MREIKFRVWDKELKQMAYATTELFDNALSFWVMIHLDDDEPEWMQYTGLKDKNGKEMCMQKLSTVLQALGLMLTI